MCVGTGQRELHCPKGKKVRNEIFSAVLDSVSGGGLENNIQLLTDHKKANPKMCASS